MSSISTISNLSFSSTYSSASGTQRRQRPSSEEMASDLFSKLDTSGKGYIQQSDLETALSALSSSSTSSDSTTSASEIFSQLDSDGDGKVTKDEMTSSFEKLAEELDSQFDQARMQSAMGNMPPPPPQDDAGFTQEELENQLTEIGSTDSQRSSLLSKVVENFDTADTNQDGKVSFQEAMAYDESTSDSTSSSTSSSDSTSTSSTSSTQTSDAKVFRQLMELLRTYGDGSQSDSSSFSTLSALISTQA